MGACSYLDVGLDRGKIMGACCYLDVGLEWGKIMGACCYLDVGLDRGKIMGACSQFSFIASRISFVKIPLVADSPIEQQYNITDTFIQYNQPMSNTKRNIQGGQTGLSDKTCSRVNVTCETNEVDLSQITYLSHLPMRMSGLAALTASRRPAPSSCISSPPRANVDRS